MLQPLGDRILVKPKSPEKYTESGLSIPDSMHSTMQAEVLAVGDGRMPSGGIDVVLELRCKPGDVIVLMKDTGIEYSENKEKYLILREDQVLGIVR